MKHPLQLIDKNLRPLSPRYLNLVMRTYLVVIPLIFTVAIRHLFRGIGHAIRGRRKQQFREFLAGAAIWGKYVARANRVEVECVNELNVPDSGHLIFVNHVNEMDFPFDSLVLQRPYLANQVIRRAPPAYLWMRAMGSQVFDNSKARSIKQSVDNLLRHLPTQAYIVYPEGANTYSETIQPLRKGMSRVAFENEIPVYVALKSGITGFQKQQRDLKVCYMEVGLFDPRDYASWSEFRDAIHAAMVAGKGKLDERLARSETPQSTAHSA